MVGVLGEQTNSILNSISIYSGQFFEALLEMGRASYLHRPGRLGPKVSNQVVHVVKGGNSARLNVRVGFGLGGLMLL